MQPICKICDLAQRKIRAAINIEHERQRTRDWIAANRERKKRVDRQYHLANRDQHIAQFRAYYLANKEKVDATNRAWNAANSEKLRAARKAKRDGPDGEQIRARRRKHYAANKARYVANARRRERRIARATPAWADLGKIADIYMERERITIETGVTHHVDHIIPLRGKWVWGLHVENNLQIIPALDNLTKSNKLLEAA